MPYSFLRKFLRMDWLLFGLVVCLASASVAFIYSATYTSDDPGLRAASKAQLYWIPLAIIAFFVFSLVDYKWWLKIAIPFALGMLTLLGLVLVIGEEVNGAKSWIRFGGIGIQPAEFSKLAFVLLLAKFLASRDVKRVRNFWTVFVGGTLTIIPAVLILLQPDAGSAGVFFPTALLMMFVAGAGLLYVSIPVGAVVLGAWMALHGIYYGDWHGRDYEVKRNEVEVKEPVFRTRDEAIRAGVIPPATINEASIVLEEYQRLGSEDSFQLEVEDPSDEASVSTDIGVQMKNRLNALRKKAQEKNEVFIFHLLKEYQINRIKTFFNPNLDPKGAGWTINQSLIAIGSGGWDGKGYKQGTQNVLGYLPKNVAYNDFIFSVIGEEWGFVGGSLVILAQGLILLLCMRSAFFARDKAGMLIATGVSAILFTHLFINVGMTIQVVPITGIPLPFISYGGSFLVVCMAGVGLVQSVWIHRKPLAKKSDKTDGHDEPARFIELERRRAALAEKPKRAGVGV